MDERSEETKEAAEGYRTAEGVLVFQFWAQIIIIIDIIRRLFLKTAAVFLVDGFEEIEALSPVDYLRRAGVEVYTVAVPSPTMQDPYIVTGSHKVPVIADLTLDEYMDSCKDELPDCVVCPGGMPGATNLAASDILLSHLEKCFDEGKLVSALCASPAVVLGKTKIPAGKEWTCYPGMQDNAKAGDKVQDFTDKSMIKIEKHQLETKRDCKYEELGLKLSQLLLEGATINSSNAAEIAIVNDLQKEILTLSEQIAQKDQIL